jgi:precorrin-2 C20-methyltransferase/precorrin-3B C17-methyltransferase
VGGAGERIRVVRLADLDPATVDMRTLLLIGSSRTRLAERGGGEQVVFTPRNYPADS